MARMKNGNDRRAWLPENFSPAPLRTFWALFTSLEEKVRNFHFGNLGVRAGMSQSMTNPVATKAW